MKKIKSITTAAFLGAYGIVSPLLGASESLPSRQKFEQFRIGDSTTTKMISGIGSNNQFGEEARIIYTDSDKYTLEAGVKFNTNLNETQISGSVFGNTGDLAGIGTETKIQTENLATIVNVETAKEDRQRLGLGFECNTDNTLFGIAYDNQEIGNNSKNIISGKIIHDFSNKNAAGIGFTTTDNIVGTSAFYWHGNDNWGARAFVNTIVNTKTNVHKGKAQLILAENPTTGKPGATWWVSRNVQGDGAYNPSVVGIGVNRVELVYPTERMTSGFATQLDFDWNKTEDNLTQQVKAEIACRRNLSEDISIAGSVLGSTDFEKNNSIGGSLQAEYGNLQFLVRHEEPISGNAKSNTYARAQLTFNW